MFTVTNIKKGFNNSIGCNLKKYKFNHLFAPFTSIPIIGTKAKRIKEIINKGIITFFKNTVSINEIVIIITKAKMVKIKCFEKKKKKSLFNLSPAKVDGEENEKKKTIKKKNKKIKKKFL